MKAILVSIAMVATLVAGCDSQPATSVMPEVNDENCKDENIGKIRDKGTQRAFADLCFTRGDFKPSPKREW